MEGFGIGESFIRWVKMLYSNATTKIKLNGYLSTNIPLNRGVRQGCPLSSLLYVLVIEILALQLRKNPNIVGFKVGGEKIISLHYADDATISIKQNRCFKEVIKDLTDYELASGAKVNYNKTKGLWLGKWKTRQDKPLNIEWTNGNVKSLGVYFGNEDPAKQTFEEIVPKVRRSMDYWKQFNLSTFAKARIVEIFHASRLWYAATFYPIPLNIETELQKAFFAYINFPHSIPTVSQKEMQKLRQDGGVKLINIRTKANTYKTKWLMELMTTPELRSHQLLMSSLIGIQKGGLEGIDLFFTTQNYTKRILKTQNKFYREAIQAITKLQVKKKIDDPGLEKVFYNPTFLNERMETIHINYTCQNREIYTYGQIQAEHAKQQNNTQHNKNIAKIYNLIAQKDLENRTDNVMYNTNQKKFIKFEETSHKDVYQEFIKMEYKDHHSKLKWEQKFSTSNIDWDKVWNSLNNPLTSEDTKTTIWEQIHLNEYTTYSYNKWHHAEQNCPFCSQIPNDEFHITLDCPMTISLWAEIEPKLQNIHQSNVIDTEKVFGIPGDSPNVILRNWLTFTLRQCVLEQERKAYYNKKGMQNLVDVKLAYNQTIKTEVWKKYNVYKNLGRDGYFKRMFAVNDYLIVWENEQWNILTIFSVS